MKGAACMKEKTEVLFAGCFMMNGEEDGTEGSFIAPGSSC